MAIVYGKQQMFTFIFPILLQRGFFGWTSRGIAGRILEAILRRITATIAWGILVRISSENLAEILGRWPAEIFNVIPAGILGEILREIPGWITDGAARIPGRILAGIDEGMPGWKQEEQLEESQEKIEKNFSEKLLMFDLF